MAKYPGKWLDYETGKVVDKAPQRGMQLLAPGIEPSLNALAYAADVEASLEGTELPAVIGTETLASRPEQAAADPEPTRVATVKSPNKSGRAER